MSRHLRSQKAELSKRKIAALRIQLGLIILIANAKVQGEMLGNAPLVLEKTIKGFAANIRWRSRILEKLAWSSKNEIGHGISRCDSTVIEIKLPVDIKVV